MKATSPAQRKAPGAPTRPPNTSPGHSTLPAAMLTALRRVILYQSAVNLGECAALLLTCLAALWSFQALADLAFNLPWPVRACLLAGDIGAAAYLVAVFGINPWRRKLTLSTAALLIERQIPGFRSALISAVELSRSPSGSPALARVLIERTGARLAAGGGAGRVVGIRRLQRWSIWALASVAIAAGAFAAARPTSQVLLARLFLSARPLPTRTVVIAISGDATVALGADIALAARAQGVVPRSGRLLVAYANGERAAIVVQPRADDGAVFALTLKNVQQSFTYHFELNDGAGPPFRVTAQVPPAMASCRFEQTYPAYTRRRATMMSAGNLSLLAGSRVRVEGRATQALRSATLKIDGPKPAASTLAVTGADKHGVSGDFAVPKEGLNSFSILLINAEGVASTDNTVYSVEFMPDHPPVVELTAPVAERSTVSAAARPGLRYAVRDDFGIKQVTLRYEVEHPAAPGIEPQRDRGEIPLASPEGVASFAGDYAWELAKQPGFSVGCTVSFWVEAADNNDVTGPGVGQSPKKTLVILSEQEKRAELLERLGAGAAGIEELYQSQLKVNEDLNSMIHQGTP